MRTLLWIVGPIIAVLVLLILYHYHRKRYCPKCGKYTLSYSNDGRNRNCTSCGAKWQSVSTNPWLRLHEGDW